MPTPTSLADLPSPHPSKWPLHSAVQAEEPRPIVDSSLSVTPLMPHTSTRSCWLDGELCPESACFPPPPKPMQYLPYLNLCFLSSPSSQSNSLLKRLKNKSINTNPNAHLLKAISDHPSHSELKSWPRCRLHVLVSGHPLQGHGHLTVPPAITAGVFPSWVPLPGTLLPSRSAWPSPSRHAGLSSEATSFKMTSPTPALPFALRPLPLPYFPSSHLLLPDIVF